MSLVPKKWSVPLMFNKKQKDDRLLATLDCMHFCSFNKNHYFYSYSVLFYFFFNSLHTFSKLYLLFFKTLNTNPRIAHTKCKMPHISCKMKHCIQNITNTSQKQTFAIILIPVRFLCYIENCVVFCKKCLWNWKLSQRLIISVWFCRFGVCFWCLSVSFQKLCDK